jgi:hypothetical protein
MELLIAALALGTLAVGAYVTARNSQRHRQAQLSAGSCPIMRTIEDLRAGDVLLQDGRVSLLVRQVWHYRDHEREWREACVQAEATPIWLVVRPGANTEVLVGQRIDCPPILQHPPQQLDNHGVVYRLERRGRADCKQETPVNNHSANEVAYWDYRGVGDRRAWVRHGVKGYACFAGSSVPAHTLDLLPG